MTQRIIFITLSQQCVKPVPEGTGFTHCWDKIRFREFESKEMKLMLSINIGPWADNAKIEHESI